MIVLHGRARFGISPRVRTGSRVAGIILIALLGFAGAMRDASARPAAFADSSGRVDFFDTSNPGKYAMPAMTEKIGPIKAVGPTFTVAYQDVISHTGVGFDGPQGAQWQARISEILSYLGTLLNETGSCDVLFAVSPPGGSGELAHGGTSFWVTPGFTNGFAFDHISTGVSPSPGSADVNVTVYYQWNWYSGTGTTPGNQVDFTSVLLHEVTHGLGLFTLVTQTGASAAGVYLQTQWDNLLETGNGKKLYNSSAHFMGFPSDLTGGDGGICFTGTNTVAVYGLKPPVYAPPSWQEGSSISHWDSSIVGGAVMEPAISDGEMHRTYAQVDCKALKDIGYMVMGLVSTKLPQAGFKEVGDLLVMQVGASGATGTVSYQWKKDGGPLAGGATTYTISSLVLADQGWYSCAVTDDTGTYETPPTYLSVFTKGSLPTTGMIGLGIVIAACILAGAFVILRKV